MLDIMNPVHVIRTLFSQLIDWQLSNPRPDFTEQKGRELGMLFRFDLSCHNHGYEKDGNTHHPEWEASSHCHIEVCVTQNRKAFVAYRFQGGRYCDPQWKNVSNHDSCWIDAIQSEFETVYFESYNRCWCVEGVNVPDEHRVAPVAANIQCRFSDYAKAFQLVVLHLETDYEKDTSGYFKKIVSMTPVDYSLSIKEN